jgi:hypothetical protein
MAGHQTTHATDDLVPLAWAGLMLDVPPTYRPFKVEGNARKGMIGLADDQGVRLELAWGVPRRRRFDALEMLTRKLKGTMPRQHRGRHANRHIETRRDLPAFETLLGYHDEEHELDRWLGFVPKTRRALEIVYHHGSTRQDRQFRARILPSLTEQPPDAPQRWAFFGHHLTTPADFAYRDATLNIGDMQIVVTASNRPRSRAAVTVQLIYPAQLALARNPLNVWLSDHIGHRKRAHRPRYNKLFQGGGIVHQSFDSPLGTGLTADAHLRRMLKVVSWTTPWRKRTWVIHDQQHDRLLIVDALDNADRFDAIIATIVAGLHWT